MAADAPREVTPVSVAPRSPANCALLAGTISMAGAERATALAWWEPMIGRAEKASALKSAELTIKPRIIGIWVPRSCGEVLRNFLGVRVCLEATDPRILLKQCAGYEYS